MHIIVLGGYSKSGKDTFADYLVKTHGYQKFYFAKTLKDECAKVYEMNIKYFYDETLKDKTIASVKERLLWLIFTIGLCLTTMVLFGTIINLIIFSMAFMYGVTNKRFKTPRKLLIEYSQKCRAKNKSYFVDALFNSINYDINKIVISDCRMKNELDYIQNKFTYNHVSVWMNRSNYNVNTNDNTQLTSSDFDITVDNIKNPFNGKDIVMQLLKKDKNIQQFL